MTTLRYAAYGSNLHPHRLRRRVPSATLLGSAFVAEGSLRFHKQGMDGSGKCDLVESGAGAYVAVYSMAASEKPLLDRYEHVGIGYNTARLEVRGFGECFTYRASESHIVDGLAPYCWYAEMVLTGCIAHGFPDDYLDMVRAVAPLRDPNAARRREQWQLVEAMRLRPDPRGCT